MHAPLFAFISSTFFQQISICLLEWLDRVDQVTWEAEELMMKDENTSCFNLKSRYQLGRQAFKKAQDIDGIQEPRNFPEGISYVSLHGQ